MAIVVSDKLFRNAKLGDNMVEHEMNGCLTIIFNCGHSLCPFREIIDSHYNVMMPPAEARLQSIKSSPHFVKGLAVTIGCNRAGCEHILRANTSQG